MAGFDLRWASPIGSAPYALYGQMIGEDESSYLPVEVPRSARPRGVEAVRSRRSGAGLRRIFQHHLFGMSGGRPRYDCAYNQGQFDVEGYRYHGRVIGHTMDRDAEGVDRRRHAHRYARRRMVGDGASRAAQSRRLRPAQHRECRSGRIRVARAGLARPALGPVAGDRTRRGVTRPRGRRPRRRAPSASSAGATTSIDEQVPAGSAGRTPVGGAVALSPPPIRGWLRGRSPAQRHPVARGRRHPARTGDHLAFVVARHRA